jgi:hypothetical protein
MVASTARGRLSFTGPNCKRKRPELRLESRDAGRTALPGSPIAYKMVPLSTRENGTLVGTTDGLISWLQRSATGSEGAGCNSG